MFQKKILIVLGLWFWVATAPAWAWHISPLGMELVNFTVIPSKTAQSGDTIEVSYELKNISSHEMRLSPSVGAFVACRAFRGLSSNQNRDFGYTHKGLALKPGQSVKITARRLLSHSGTWSFWPAFLANEQWGSFKSRVVMVRVGGDAKPAPQGKAGGGATVVSYKGELLPIQVFPPDNPWNQDISELPIHPHSRAYVVSIGKNQGLHPDFSAGWGVQEPHGLAFEVVRAGQKKVPVKLSFPAESDLGPFPIPDDFPVAKKGDRQILLVDYDAKKLYELYGCHRTAYGWEAMSAAVFDLTSNKYRPLYWTSADAAGLPIFAGLVRQEEVTGPKDIPHALRFTARRTQKAFVLPATHYASNRTDPNLPPLGMRFRLKADFDISGFGPQAQVILRCLKKYGMFLSDNGGNWYLTGAPSPGWDDDDIGALKKVKGYNFEAVYTGGIIK